MPTLLISASTREEFGEHGVEHLLHVLFLGNMGACCYNPVPATAATVAEAPAGATDVNLEKLTGDLLYFSLVNNIELAKANAESAGGGEAGAGELIGGVRGDGERDGLPRCAGAGPAAAGINGSGDESARRGG